MCRMTNRIQTETRLIKLSKAQSALEYAVVIAVFVAALISMSSYIKRSFQGNYRDSADQIGNSYEPKNTTSDITITSNSTSTSSATTNEVGGRLRTTDTVSSHDNTRQNGWEDVGPLP